MSEEIDRVTRERIYQETVFLIRPIGFIEPTAARRISYADSLEFEALHEAVYRDHGFALVEVPAADVTNRVAIIERHVQFA